MSTVNGTIIIAEDEPLKRSDLKEMLEQANYAVVGEAGDGFEAIALAKRHQPDLIIMDIQMPLLDGLKAGHKIMTDKLAKAILVLSADSDFKHRQQAIKFGAVGYLVKPLDEKSFIPMVETSIAMGQARARLERKYQLALQKLAERKLIEQAKGMLMTKYNVSEEIAYQRIRKISMDQRSSMIEIAEIIVAANS